MRIFLTSLFALIAVSAHAAPVADGAWVRFVPGQQNAAGYATLTFADDDTITGIASDCCEAVELHTMTMDGERMMMRKVDSIAVEQGTFEFNPGGYHIMFIGLKTEPKKGDDIPVTFTFASGDTLTVPFDVRPVGVE